MAIEQSPTISIVGGKLAIRVPYHANHLAQAFPDVKFSMARKVWLATASHANLMHIRDSWPYKYDDAVARLVADLGSVTKLKTTWPADYVFKTLPRPYQEEDTQRAFTAGRFGLFLEQGLGKSKVAIDTMAAHYKVGNIRSVLILCPAAIDLVWHHEFATHCPTTYAIGTTDKPPQGHGLQVVIQSIEGLSVGGDAGFNKALDWVNGPHAGRVGLIIDESTKVKNHKAGRSERAVQLADGCATKLILTGTPVSQGYEDLYMQIRVLGHDILGYTSYYGFRGHYVVMGGFQNKKVIGYSRIDELLDKIRPFVSRRLKRDVAKDLPEKNPPQPRYCAMKGEQARAYNEISANMETKVDGHSITADMVLEKLLRLQQISGGFYSTSPEMVEDPEPSQVHYFKEQPKLHAMFEYMEDNAGPFVVWAKFQAEVAMIEEACRNKGMKTATYYGPTPKADRPEIVKAFQRGEYDVLVCSYAAAYGLTLTQSNKAIYYSRSFSLEEMLQSEDRIHRIGQNDACDYTVLEFRNASIDKLLTQAYERKLTMAEYVSAWLTGKPIKTGKGAAIQDMLDMALNDAKSIAFGDHQ